MESIYKSLSKDNKFYAKGNKVITHQHLLFWDKENHIAEDIGTTSDIIVDNAIKYAIKSGFGNMKTLTTEYDDKVRDAYEIHVDNIFQKFSFNPNDIGLFGDNTVKVVPYKFTIYKEGGFFSKHTDSCTNSDMLGTLVWVFKPADSGGEFRINDVILPMSNAGDWCFLYGDCEHEVKKVTKGTRISLIFRVYATGRIPNQTCIELYTKSIDDKVEYILNTVASNNSKYGFITHHNYGGGEPKECELKGIDSVFYKYATARFGKEYVSIHPVKVWSIPQTIDSIETPHAENDEIEIGDLTYEDMKNMVICESGEITNTWKEGEKDYSGHSGNEASHMSVLYQSVIICIRNNNNKRLKTN